jgi:hypothetical protein
VLKVDQFDLKILTLALSINLHKDILRFDIAMNNIALLKGVKHVSHTYNKLFQYAFLRFQICIIQQWTWTVLEHYIVKFSVTNFVFKVLPRVAFGQ